MTAAIATTVLFAVGPYIPFVVGALVAVGIYVDATEDGRNARRREKEAGERRRAERRKERAGRQATAPVEPARVAPEPHPLVTDLPKPSRALLRTAQSYLDEIDTHAGELAGQPALQQEIEALRTDYLPTAVALYRDTPSDLRGVANSDGLTPEDEVQQQLTIIVDRLGQIRREVHSGKRRRSAVHTEFLRERYSRTERPNPLDVGSGKVKKRKR